MDIKEIGCGLDSCGSGYDLTPGSSEHGNEPSGSMKGEKFLATVARSHIHKRHKQRERKQV
jgi:hypothetical protein